MDIYPDSLYNRILGISHKSRAKKINIANIHHYHLDSVIPGTDFTVVSSSTAQKTQFHLVNLQR